MSNNMINLEALQDQSRMYRHERQAPRSPLDMSEPKDSGEVRRGPKNLPSGSQLPTCWNESMDRALCHMEAQNELDPKAMLRLLKRRFSELESYVIPMEAIQRRLDTLDLQDNVYFKTGMETAVANAEAKGFDLPPYDPLNYPIKVYTFKSDLEIFGSGAPMTGTLAYGAAHVSESQPVTRGVGRISVGEGSKKAQERQVSSRNEVASIRRGVDQHNINNITNNYDIASHPVTSTGSNVPSTSSMHMTSPASTNLPATPVNSQSTQNFSTPSSKDTNRNRVEAGNNPGSQNVATPSSKDRHRKRSEAGLLPGSLYRSGKENTVSGMSTTTTGTSILGREISGMSAAMERRHARVDQRLTPED